MSVPLQVVHDLNIKGRSTSHQVEFLIDNYFTRGEFTVEQIHSNTQGVSASSVRSVLAGLVRLEALSRQWVTNHGWGGGHYVYRVTSKWAPHHVGIFK